MAELTPVLEQGKCPYKTCNSAFFLQHAGVSGFTFINHRCVKCNREIWTRVGGGSLPESFPLDTFHLHFGQRTCKVSHP